MGRWTASTTGSERKGFEFGTDSSTASAVEVKGSEWAQRGKRKRREKEDRRRNRKIMVERGVRKVKKRS